MIERERREKLMALVGQAEKTMDELNTDHPDFLLAVRICRTVCDDVREACVISEKSDALLIDKLERIRRLYETGE